MTLFNSKGWMPESTLSATDVTAVDFAALPPILRTLLVTDGTVTKTLEAYFSEQHADAAAGNGCR